MGLKKIKINTFQINKFLKVFILIIFSLSWIIGGLFVADLIKIIILFFMPILIWVSIPETLNSYKWIKNTFIIYAIHRMILTMVMIAENRLNIFNGINNPILKNGLCILFPFAMFLFVYIISYFIVRVLQYLRSNIILELLSGGRH